MSQEEPPSKADFGCLLAFIGFFFGGSISWFI